MWIMWTEPSVSYGTDNSLSTSNDADCPTAAVTGLATRPRCMFFRVTL